ncbi:MAG TPA: L,D-transpeptidase family protein, partial [Desulfosarcina sp.]|nr:L,D-transpeptidase family protein [Desulfosarcina sp.]
MKSSIITILALTLAALTGFPAAVAAPLPSADDTLLAWLAPFAVQPQHRSAAVGTDPLLSVAQFYHAVGYRPVWTGVDGMLPQGESLMQVMAGAPEAGLFAEAYDPFLDAGQGAGTVLFSGMPFLPRLSAHARLDVMLTEALLRMAGNLSSGRIAPEALYGQWLAWRRPPRENLAVALARAVNEGRLVEFVESLHPRSRDYMALRKSLAQYRRIAQDGGWPTVAPGATLKPGDAGPRVEALRRRLAATDDAKGVLSAAPAETGFDGVLEAAVRRFQHRHGLHVDGLVGQRTLDELNVPVEARITALKLNMERRRWLPDDLGDRHLLANIPDFTLCIVARGKTIDRMRAVVGREDRQTPVMSGRITYLEFNPYWNIPQKIAREDILPNAVRDPGYFSRQGIRVYDTWDARATELDP